MSGTGRVKLRAETVKTVAQALVAVLGVPAAILGAYQVFFGGAGDDPEPRDPAPAVAASSQTVSETEAPKAEPAVVAAPAAEPARKPSAAPDDPCESLRDARTPSRPRFDTLEFACTFPMASGDGFSATGAARDAIWFEIRDRVILAARGEALACGDGSARCGLVAENDGRASGGLFFGAQASRIDDDCANIAVDTNTGAMLGREDRFRSCR